MTAILAFFTMCAGAPVLFAFGLSLFVARFI
jgi:hypothetical protein